MPLPPVDLITRHRLDMLGLAPDDLESVALRARLDLLYRTFLQRVPYENLSNNQACRSAPGDPGAWPRTTDRFLRENRSYGLGGTSFSLAYALRDLMQGLGANAHCTLGHNLVTEEAHAAVVVYLDEGPLLYDPALLVSGPLPVRPGGELADPLGSVSLRPRCGPTLTVTLRMHHLPEERSIYSIIPVPSPPNSYRQAWIASFHRGRVRPLRFARRVGDEIRRYGERPGSLEILNLAGREHRTLDSAPVDELNALFGVSTECLSAWFDGHPGGCHS